MKKIKYAGLLCILCALTLLLAACSGNGGISPTPKPTAAATTVNAVASTSSGSEIPAATDQFYVDDFSEVIDETTESYIVEHAAELYEKTGAQIVVATVNFIGKSTIENYAKEMFNAWGIGDSEKQNGVLLLMVIGSEDYWCTQGKGLTETLQSGTLQLILDDYLEPAFAKEDYSGGAMAFFVAVYNELANLYGVDEISDASDAVTDVARPGANGIVPDVNTGSKGFSRNTSDSAASVSGIPQPTDMFYVYDAANVIDQYTEEFIVNYSAKLFDYTGAQIVIVAVEDTGDLSITDYAYYLFNSWGIGDAQRNNGLLLVMSIGKEDYWALQGYGIENDLTVDIMGDMLREYLEPDFAVGAYSDGAAKFFEAAYNWFVDFYGAGEIELPHFSLVDGMAV